MNKIERDKRTVTFMIQFYCRFKLHQSEISPEYRALIDYACRRLDFCKFGVDKPACKNCKIHCYSPMMREKICEIMRWVGPRMFFLSPMASYRHFRNR